MPYLLVARRSLRSDALQRQRDHARLFGCCADDAQARNLRQSLRRVNEQMVLVLGDIVKADPLDVIDRCTQTDRVGDVAGAGFEPLRRSVKLAPLERDVADHVAAALIGRQRVHQVLLAVQRADASRCEHLVA